MSVEVNKPSIWKNFKVLIILFVAGAFIYALPYLKNYYYDTFAQAFNLTNTQMGSLGSIYGLLAMVSYLLVVFSRPYFSQKIAFRFFNYYRNIWFCINTLSSIYRCVLIHALWGITTILTFWPALVKAVRMLASENEQGKAFGFMESGRGITNAIHLSLVLILFGYISSKVSDKSGLTAIIVLYSAINVIVGVLVFFKLKDNEKEVSAKFDKEAFCSNKNASYMDNNNNNVLFIFS